MNGRPAQGSGVTLVEVLIALAVVAIALFAIAAVQVGASTASAQARQIADARDVASRGIADLRAAVISDAVTDPSRWDELRDCDVPSGSTFPPLAFGGGGAPPATSECSGQYVEQGLDAVGYAFRWTLGPPGTVQIEDAAGTVAAQSLQSGMLRLLVRLDWERRGIPFTLSFEDFISCVDVDLTFCPIGDG